MDKKMLSLQVHNLKFEVSDEKPNWMPFTGVCLFTDVPSDGVPGSDCGIDKPVMFPKEEVEKSLSTFENMGVDCVWPEYGCPEYVLSGHDTRNKIGVMTSASLDDNKVTIKGGLWAWDFSDVCDMVKVAKESLGWSVEVSMNAEDGGDYYIAKDLDFSGCALLFADDAAFSKTYLAAQKRKDVEHMNKEEMQAMLDAMFVKFEEKISTVNEQVEKISSDFAAEKQAKEEEKAALALAAQEKLEADAKIAEDAKVAAELAAKEKLDSDAKLAEEAKRKTVQFGVVLSKFSNASEEVKGVVADEKLTGSQKFQKLINLKLQEKK
jgi:hypothetical protein